MKTHHLVLSIAIALAASAAATPQPIPPVPEAGVVLPPSATHKPIFTRTAVPVTGLQPVVAVTVVRDGVPVRTGSGVLHVKVIENALIENYVFTARSLVADMNDILVSFVTVTDSDVQWPITNKGWIGETTSAATVIWQDDTIACLHLIRALGVNGAIFREQRAPAFSGEKLLIRAHVHVFGNGKVNVTGPYRVSLTDDAANSFGDAFQGAGVFDISGNCIGLIVRLGEQQVIRFPTTFEGW